MRLTQVARRLSGVAPGEIDMRLVPRVARHVFHHLKTLHLRFPRDEKVLRESDLFRSWWYYDVELLPGVVTKGLFPRHLPMLPRMLARNCDVKGMTCLDIGSMEGLIPALLARRGAQRVLATDVGHHCLNRISAVKHYHGVEFDFAEFGLLYSLDKTLRSHLPSGADFINASGILYHVFSPMQVIAGLRPILRKNGLIILSTNVIPGDEPLMKFNSGGRYQTEACTFWYMTVPLFAYLLKYFKLTPIDALFLKYPESDTARYVADEKVGYLSVVCRATEDEAALVPDEWMQRSWRSVEYVNLCNVAPRFDMPESQIAYKGGRPRFDLLEWMKSVEPLERTQNPQDTHLLRLADET